MAGAQQLWVPLLKQHSTDPVNLQWLPLLACWLSTAGSELRIPAEEPAQGRHVSPAAVQSRSTSPKKLPARRTHRELSQQAEQRTGASTVPAEGRQHDGADAQGAYAPSTLLCNPVPCMQG